MTSSNPTETTPSYNGGPVFRVGEPIRNLSAYCGFDREVWGHITAIVGPYDVELRTLTGKVTERGVETIGHVGEQRAADDAKWLATR